MIIYPAIDVYEGKAVRLFNGKYDEMTVYSDNPVRVAIDFKDKGGERIHVVDIEGARTGEIPNFDTVFRMRQAVPDLFIEVGGGIRTMEVVDRYLAAGINRVILGTAAVNDNAFLEECVKKYGERIAVTVDIKDKKVAIKGWTETSDLDAYEFIGYLQDLGVKSIIVTDITKDGAMSGTNLELYDDIVRKFDIEVIAAGGIRNNEDVKLLADRGVQGAIIGKAYYTGDIKLGEAIYTADK